ncbi:MAG: DUF5050 domain-containing protein [Clostridiaceae bacterium]|nr:DUF5050 domain-containing protein [Clostridiaceae bacterium]
MKKQKTTADLIAHPLFPIINRYHKLSVYHQIKGAASLAAILVAVALVCGCGQTDAANPTQSAAETRISDTASSESDGADNLAVPDDLIWSGNLNYQNIVISVQNKIIYNNRLGQICTADPDGKNATVLSEQAGSYFCFSNQRLFYTEGLQNGVLNKIKLDGTNAVRIGQQSLKYMIADQNWIIAIDPSTGQVIRFDQDGTNRKLLCDFSALALAYDGQYLYISGTHDESGLVRCLPDSGEQTVLINHRISSLNIVGQELYYADPTDNNRLHVWSAENGQDKRLGDISLANPFIIANRQLYFIDPDDQNRIYARNLDALQAASGQASLIVDDSAEAFVLIDEYLYYQRTDSTRIYRVPNSGGQPVRID